MTTQSAPMLDVLQSFQNLLDALDEGNATMLQSTADAKPVELPISLLQQAKDVRGKLDDRLNEKIGDGEFDAEVSIQPASAVTLRDNILTLTCSLSAKEEIATNAAASVKEAEMAFSKAKDKHFKSLYHQAAGELLLYTAVTQNENNRAEQIRTFYIFSNRRDAAEKDEAYANAKKQMYHKASTLAELTKVEAETTASDIVLLRNAREVCNMLHAHQICQILRGRSLERMDGIDHLLSEKMAASDLAKKVADEALIDYITIRNEYTKSLFDQTMAELVMRARVNGKQDGTVPLVKAFNIFNEKKMVTDRLELPYKEKQALYRKAAARAKQKEADANMILRVKTSAAVAVLQKFARVAIYRNHRISILQSVARLHEARLSCRFEI